MNKEDPYRDHAEKLKKKIERSAFEEGQPVNREELPPRSAVHRKGKTKLKVKYPIIRLLALFFILLPITVISIYSTVVKDKINHVKETNNESTEEFETIEIEKENPVIEDKKKAEEEEKQDLPKEEGADPGNGENGGVPDESQSSLKEDAGEHGVAAAPLAVQEKDIVYHKVKNGETISKLAIKYYKSKAGIETIKSANNLTSNEILAGQVLIIPLNK